MLKKIIKEAKKEIEVNNVWLNPELSKQWLEKYIIKAIKDFKKYIELEEKYVANPVDVDCEEAQEQYSRAIGYNRAREEQAKRADYYINN